MTRANFASKEGYFSVPSESGAGVINLSRVITLNRDEFAERSDGIYEVAGKHLFVDYLCNDNESEPRGEFVSGKSNFSQYKYSQRRSYLRSCLSMDKTKSYAASPGSTTDRESRIFKQFGWHYSSDNYQPFQSMGHSVIKGSNRLSCDVSPITNLNHGEIMPNPFKLVTDQIDDR